MVDILIMVNHIYHDVFIKAMFLLDINLIFCIQFSVFENLKLLQFKTITHIQDTNTSPLEKYPVVKKDSS